MNRPCARLRAGCRGVMAGLILFTVCLPGTSPAHAAGSLLVRDFTHSEASPNAGEITAELVPRRWDPRCIPVEFRLNNTRDPLPDPTGLGATSLADAAVALEDALNRWNDIPTSYIEMRLVGTVSNPGGARFDMINEVTFNSNFPVGTLGFATVTATCEDAEFPGGLDIDGDRDADFVAGIDTCQDVDGDGDVEFPAGFYPAGTILESDITLNSRFYRFATTPDTELFSLDIEALAVHEFGHAMGLSHSLINQISTDEPDSSTMFALVDLDDPATQFALRSPHAEDVAFSSFFYPEGSDISGPAALQPGDIAFADTYGMIEGKVVDGTFGGPLVAAVVTAVDKTTGAAVSSAFSGRVRISYDPVHRVNHPVEGNPDFHFLDGKYRLPVPPGDYALYIEAVDGTPLGPGSVGEPAQLSQFFHRQNFPREFYNKRQEGALEDRPGQSVAVEVGAGETIQRIDFVSNRQAALAPFGSLDQLGFTDAGGGTFYAVAFPGDEVLAAADDVPFSLTAGLFYTSVLDSSVAPIFQRALLTRCTVSGNRAEVDLQGALRQVRPFVGREGDLSPFYFPGARALGKRVLEEIRRGRISHLCLVLEVPPGPYPGVSAVPPLIGLDGDPATPGNDVPILGLSFRSDDGKIFEASSTSNFLFALSLTPAAEPAEED